MVFYQIIEVLIYLAIAFCFYNVLLGLIKGEVIGKSFKRIYKYGNVKQAKEFQFHFYKYLITGIFALIIMLLI